MALITGKLRLEVKSDRLTAKTGNIVIEFEYKGKPSGISTSTAQWWAIQLEEGKIIFIESEKLKDLCRYAVRSGRGRIVSGGDDNLSRMVQIPLRLLIEPEINKRGAQCR